MQHGSSIPRRHRTGRRVAVVIAAVAVVAIVAAVVVAHLSDTGVITSPLGGDTQPSDETMRDRYPMTPSDVDFDGDGVDDYTGSSGFRVCWVWGEPWGMMVGCEEDNRRCPAACTRV